MIKVIKSEERYHQDSGWLDTRWHFSFDTYYDPANVHWGALRVFNDDVIRSGQGFPMHGHRDMEIITYVLEGALEHQDSMGNKGVIRPGEVQVMTAGTGIMHAEYNHSKQEPVHLLQLWVLPRARGLQPRWEQRSYADAFQDGQLLPVVSGGELPGTLTINQNAQIYLGKLGAGKEVQHPSHPGRKTYVFAIAGDFLVNGTPLAAGDQARIADEAELKLQARRDSHLVLLDLPDVR